MIEEITILNETIGDSIFVDMLVSPFVLIEVDLGSVNASHTTSKFVNQIGEFLENSTLGERAISIVGYVLGDSEAEIKNRKNKLSRLVNPLENMAILVDEYRLNFVADSTVKYSVTYQENNDVMCKFMITGKAYNPLFEDREQNRKTVASTLGRFRFPLTIPKKNGIIMGERTNSLIATLVNDGQVDVGMKIVIEAKATVVNPIIIDVETQEFIKLNKTMVEGERITINTNEGEESVRGQTGNGVEDNYFGYWDLDGSWLKLRVGDTLLRYDAEQDTIKNMEVIVYYSQRYLEVQ